MLEKNEISFVTFLLYQLSEAWHISPSKVYEKKSMRSGKGRPTVSVYDLKDDYTGYNVLNFRDPEDDEKWLDFVCDCRDGKRNMIL